MQKILLIISFLAMFGVVAKAQSPQKVALSFSKALLALDCEKAAQYGTENTKKFLLQLQTAFAQAGDTELLKKALAKEIDPKKLKMSCTTTGTDADCRLCCNQYGEPAPESIHLVKEGKKWLVDIRKER